MNLSRFKIGTRLILGFGLIMVFMITLVVLAIVGVKDFNKRMDNIIQQNNKSIWYANVIKDSIHTINEAILTIVLANDEAFRQFENVKILTARATYGETLEKLKKTEKTENGNKLIKRLDIATNVLNDYQQKVIQYNGNHKEAISYYMNVIRPYVLNLQQICIELVMYEEEQSNIAYNEAMKTYNIMFYAFLIIAALTILIAIITALILTRGITKPLSEGVAIANRVAEGDLSVNIDIKTHDETGRLLSSIKNMVNKLKQMKDIEVQLFQSQKLETVGRLSGGIAHDFNNMLSVILGNAQLISMTSKDTKIRERCSSIEDAVSKAAGFIRQLLAFSRKQVLDLQHVYLNSMITDFEKMIRRIIGENIEIYLELTSLSSTVKVDTAQMNQVLLNLIVNAREAMPEGGELTIKTDVIHADEEFCKSLYGANPGRYAVLMVKDTGLGMEKEVIDKIFDPFFTTKETGTGLGLSVVYGIVKQHGGFITVNSVLGKGTTFSVFLPIVDNPADLDHKRSIAPVMLKGYETILVVEDDSNLRETVFTMLTFLGYNVLTAQNGLEGIEVYRREYRKIDLVLMDIIMPKISGLDAYMQMKKINNDVMIIFVTGYNAEKTLKNLDNCNDCEILQKPYSFEILSAKIRQMLDSYKNKAA